MPFTFKTGTTVAGYNPATPRAGYPLLDAAYYERRALEEPAGRGRPGGIRAGPRPRYTRALRNAGVCMIDQYIPKNPLTMSPAGYDEQLGVAPPALDYLPYTPIDLMDSDIGGVTTGGRTLINGMWIDSPEAVVEHLERFVFPRIERDIASFDEDSRVAEILSDERSAQDQLGPDILKTGFNFVFFPYLYYGLYGGTEYYFMAYALYPRSWTGISSCKRTMPCSTTERRQRAIGLAGLPPFHRLDFDMADSTGHSGQHQVSGPHLVSPLPRSWNPILTHRRAPGVALRW